MSAKRVFPWIVITITLVILASFLLGDAQERKVMALVEKYGGWGFF